jgi:hypothetical protein
MQVKMSKPKETAVSSGGTNDRVQDSAAAHGENGCQAVATDGNCSCGEDRSPPGQGGNSDHDCSFMITTFPEHISIFFGFKKVPYLFWVGVSLLLLIARMLAMVLCGEENGRFAVNIFKSLLPGLLAILIIYYSRQAKNVADAFCELFAQDYKGKMIENLNERIHLVFDNRLMIILGAILTLSFFLTLESTQIYPTPTHNIKHRAGVRDRLSVNVGLTKHRPTRQDMVSVNEYAPNIDKTGGKAILGKDPAIWGWVQLPLGKVIHLASEFEDPKGREEKWYKFLTDPPQETYAPHLPTPTQDEDLGLVQNKDRRAEIDPEWAKEFGKENKAYKPLTKTEYATAKNHRAQRLPPLLKGFYLNHPADDLWAYSQWTYQLVMLLLLFLGGAMLWCVGAIIIVTWNIGRCPPNEDVNPFSLMDLTFYPHPGKSIGAAGDLLWQIAFINGSIYSVLMVCQFFAQPDTRSMIIAGMFSPLVVVLFIVPQYNLHKLMVDAKYRKISALDDTLSASLNAINPQSPPEDIHRARNILQLQRLMSEANDWPCDLKSIAMVVSSVIIPVFMAIFTIYDHFK